MNRTPNARPQRAVLIVAVALAAGLGGRMVHAAPKDATTPYYAGVSLSHAKHYADDGTKPTSTGFGVFGGYKLSDNFALEAGYTQMGKAKAEDNVWAKNDAFWLDGVARVNVVDNLGVYARVGVAKSKRKYDVGSASKTGLKLGVGAEYAFDKNWGARLEYARYNMPDQGGFDKKVNLFSAAVTYQF